MRVCGIGALRTHSIRADSAALRPQAKTEQADANESDPYTSVVGSFRSPKLRKLPSNGPKAALC